MVKNIAIIGSGISGLTCAHLLHTKHNISVFEANDYIGGHTATKDVTVEGKSFAIDTGFIVFNDWTYPNFIKLLNKLQVAYQPTEMSFSVKNQAIGLEYNGNTINSLFAQRRNIFRPRFWRIVRDILRFNKLCKQLDETQTAESIQTLYQFLQSNHFSDDFCDNYILPMCAAIWSASPEKIKSFPLHFFLRFFKNHGLLNITNRPQWYTIKGGSRNYIGPLIEGFAEKSKLNSAVKSVTSEADKKRLVLHNGDEMLFDEVIFACHSDQALAILSEASPSQQAILGQIPYANNQVVLHNDEQILPRRKLAWASWNYQIKGYEGESQAPAALTYNMNILQRLSAPTTFCVSLNNLSDIRADKVFGQYQYAHPQFDHASITAQNKRHEISGQNGLHFCGAYWYNGFHEDGVRSALDVCASFGVTL